MKHIREDTNTDDPQDLHVVQFIFRGQCDRRERSSPYSHSCCRYNNADQHRTKKLSLKIEIIPKKMSAEKDIAGKLIDNLASASDLVLVAGVDREK